jgi:hypothetical protein
MGVDYAIIHPTPNDVLGVEGRVRLLKTRRQVESLTHTLRARGETRPLSDISIQKAIVRPDGRQEVVNVTLQRMADEAAPLEGLIRAAGPGARYEYGHVAYPLAETAERWLMSLLPEDLTSPAGVMLTNCVRDFGYDGGGVTRMRTAQGRFFARPQPLRREWRTPRGEWSLNSDQALQMLIGLGPLKPGHVLMMALVFGLMPHALPPDQLQEAARDLAARRKWLVHAPLRTPPAEAQELAGLMEKLRTACAIDAVLWIDA